MGKQSLCPGCKKFFLDGRPYSMHIKSCKDISSVTDTTLKKHKIIMAKKTQAKKISIAVHRELAQVTQNQLECASSSQDNQDVNEVPPADRSPSPQTPLQRPSGLPNRRTRLPRRYRDDLPPNPNPPIIPLFDDLEENNNEPIHPSIVSIPKSALFCTEMNSFRVYRKYMLGPPTITPDEFFTLSSISDSISIAHDPADSCSNSSWWSSFGSSGLKAVENMADAANHDNHHFAPFLNPSTFLLMSWYYNGSSTKSFTDVDKLIHDVIRQFWRKLFNCS
jgi:hypothetical protein